MNDSSRDEAAAATFERRWRDRFISFAEASDDEAEIAGWTKTGLATRLRQFTRVLRPHLNGEYWLDAGCGAGTYTRLLTHRGATATGIDYSLPTVRKALERGGERLHYCVGDATHTPFRNASFDGALCLGVTQALATSESLVKSLAANVRHGGEVWVDALNGSCIIHRVSLFWRRLRGRRPHLRYEHARSLARLMRLEGLQPVEVVWMPMFPSILSRLQPFVEARWMRWLLRVVPGLGALACHSFLMCGRRTAFIVHTD